MQVHVSFLRGVSLPQRNHISSTDARGLQNITIMPCRTILSCGMPATSSLSVSGVPVHVFVTRCFPARFAAVVVMCPAVAVTLFRASQVVGYRHKPGSSCRTGKHPEESSNNNPKRRINVF
ncbi:hypothetical protein INT08_07730 [Prosthecochloris sp. N3]|uniref:Uncharacterized protein n=1 Tax=Prosthecochloris ethylica TaxID=2743976 RepID=A0ABR9XSN9_9CHLB|nr:hypothetical protein [Prosthecochloris ethylica]MBF0585939.1 hypothetical protein [Prosthecochloris ethylica]MBF0637056.1 hypothetical protein [Prosthecochloris ethylica]NUK47293.1 hypothetical protein [Prosthecochloris ethylica]